MTTLNQHLKDLGELPLPPVTQIGMVVPDLAAGIQFYRTFLNIPTWYRPVIVESRCSYLGRPIDQHLDIAVGYTGKIQVELIQVRGRDDNIYSAHPGEAGFGFHHFGVLVSDLDKTVAAMQARGYAPLQEGMLRYAGGGVSKFAYLDTLKQAGLILELMEAKAFGLNLGMPQWLIKLGCMTGDMKRI